MTARHFGIQSRRMTSGAIDSHPPAYGPDTQAGSDSTRSKIAMCFILCFALGISAGFGILCALGQAFFQQPSGY